MLYWLAKRVFRSVKMIFWQVVTKGPLGVCSIVDIDCGRGALSTYGALVAEEFADSVATPQSQDERSGRIANEIKIQISSMECVQLRP